MILVAVLLCTLLRGVRMQESKIAAITLLTQAAMHCDDDTRLQRIVPYLLVRHADMQVGLPATQVSSTHASKQATAIAVAVAVATVTVTVVAVVCATAMLLLS